MLCTEFAQCVQLGCRFEVVLSACFALILCWLMWEIFVRRVAVSDAADRHQWCAAWLVACRSVSRAGR